MTSRKLYQPVGSIPCVLCLGICLDCKLGNELGEKWNPLEHGCLEKQGRDVMWGVAVSS